MDKVQKDLFVTLDDPKLNLNTEERLVLGWYIIACISPKLHRLLIEDSLKTWYSELQALSEDQQKEPWQQTMLVCKVLTHFGGETFWKKVGGLRDELNQIFPNLPTFQTEGAFWDAIIPLGMAIITEEIEKIILSHQDPRWDSPGAVIFSQPSRAQALRR